MRQKLRSILIRRRVHRPMRLGVHCRLLPVLVFGAIALGPASAAEDDGQDTVVEPASDDAALWRVLRHRWWRDLPEAPAIPMVEAAGPDSLTVTWSAPDSATDIDNYDVEYRAYNTPEFTSWEHPDTTTETTINSLAPSTIHHVRVRAINAAGAGDWSPTGQGTTANSVPRFVDGDATTRTLPENTPAGRDIGAPVAASDAEGGPLQYTLGGEDAESFDLDASSGQLRTREGVVYDYETRANFALTASVDDGDGGTASIAVTVEVSDVYEPPDQPDPPTVTASSSTSLEATWSEPNNTGPRIVDYDIRYQVAGTRIHHLDADQVGIFLAATVSDLDPSTDYEVQVRAINSEGVGDWSDPARGRTLANQAPAFAEGGNATREVAENTSAHSNIGGPVAASDANGDTLSYTLSGPDAAKFTIDGNSAQIATAAGAAFDHETDASHEVTVKAADPHGGQASIAVTINVADVDEPPGRVPAPTVTGVSPSTVRATWSDPDNSGPPISDYDLRYRRSNSDAFVDSPHEGTSREATIAGLARSTDYEVQVRAVNDEGTGAWSRSGNGATLDNNPPEFDEGTSTSRSVTENTPGGRDVGAPVTATDDDGDALTYSLGGTDAGAFALVASTGQLRTGSGQVFDYEADDSYEVTVSATDDHGNATQIAVAIDVADVSEPPLAPNRPSVKADDVDALEVTWTAPDNTGRPPVTRYDLQYRGSGGSFTLWPESPTDTYAELTGLEGDTYEVQVRGVNDEGNGAWSESGRGTISGNRSPTVDQSLLADVTISVGDDDKLFPVRAAFADPDGDALTLSATSRDTDTATATMSGDSVSIDGVDVGETDLDVTATDTHDASVTGSFKVTVDALPPPPPPPPPPPAPSVSLNEEETEVEIEFDVSVDPLESKAYRVRIRQKTQQSVTRTLCSRLINSGDEIVTGVLVATLSIRSFALPDTTYLVDYRHVGTSCSDTATAPWSGVAEFTTTTPGGDLDIDIVFVDPQPSEAVKLAINVAAGLWERAVTNDLTDIDYSSDPVSNPCTDSEFDGVVDDLRIYVRVQTIDGPGGTYGTAAICERRSLSGFPIMAKITLDSEDVGRLGSGALGNLALHELAHTLGFGIFWGGLLVNPSLDDGEPITPPPDTHFDGANAIAAFDDAGGTDYQGEKVPVENQRGGDGAQDSHWRKSVMGSELMTYSLGSSAPFSAITIQSMADMGYSVDDSVADPYTVFDITGSTATLASEDSRATRHCIVHPHGNINVVPEPRPMALRLSATELQVIDATVEWGEPKP